MQAVLIATEDRQEMGPLTHSRSVYTLPLGGSSLVQHAVDSLSEAGVDNIALNIDDGGIKSLFGVDRGVDRVDKDEVSIRFVNPRESLTAGLDADEPFLFVRADVLYDQESLEQLAETDTGFGYVSGAASERLHTQGNVEVSDGSVTDIKVDHHDHTGDFGAYAFKFPAEAHEWNYGAGPMATELAHTHSPEAVQFGTWTPVHKPHQLKLASWQVTGNEPVIHEDAEVYGEVTGQSVIGPSARVDEGAYVEDSILMEGAHVMTNAFVGDSIIGEWTEVEENVTFGHRSTGESNVTYDLNGESVDANTQTFGSVVGPRTQILAGKTIGAGEVIGAGVTLD